MLTRGADGGWWRSEGVVTQTAFHSARPLWNFPASLQTRALPGTWEQQRVGAEHDGVQASLALEALTARLTRRLAAAGVPRTWLRGTWMAPGADGAASVHATLWPPTDLLLARLVRRGLEAEPMRQCDGCQHPLLRSIPLSAWERLGIEPPLPAVPALPAPPAPPPAPVPSETTRRLLASAS
jgi:hypothetical protein